jgi:D-alanyl-D-alanine carboxypeptidase
MNLLYLLIPFMLVSCTKPIAQQDPSGCNAGNYSSHPKHQLYQQELEAFHNNDDAPGTLIAIKKANLLLWVGTMGKSRMESGTPMKACTPFRTGSITKVFTAVVVLKLVEQGKLQLEDKLAVLLPETKNKIPKAELITVRQLLNHTSGITDPKNDDPAYIAQITNDPESIGKMSMAERLRRFVYGRPLHFEPGTGSHYANSGYWLLGEIIEHIMHKPMQDVLVEMIFKPVGMVDSYYEKRNNPRLSYGYTYMHGNLVEVSRWDAADGDADPSSGVISTAEDLMKFGFALFTGNLLSARSMQEMLTISVTPDCGSNCAYALGIESWNAGVLKGFGKNGTSIGVDANLIFYPEQNTCLVLYKNCGNGSNKNFLERIVGY